MSSFPQTTVPSHPATPMDTTDTPDTHPLHPPTNTPFPHANPSPFESSRVGSIVNSWGTFSNFHDSPPDGLIIRHILAVGGASPHPVLYLLIQFLAETRGGGDPDGFYGGGAFLAAALTPTTTHPLYPNTPVYYEADANTRFVVKKSSHKMVNKLLKENTLENPVNEVKASQFLQGGSFGTAVRGTAVQDAALSGSDLICPSLHLFFQESNPAFMYNVMPCRGSELFYLLTTSVYQYKEKHCVFLWRQIMSAVEYMHSQNVCHRDISLENILYDGRNITVIDLGQATMGRKSLAANGAERMYVKAAWCGKRFYLAPEVYSKEHCVRSNAGGEFVYCGLGVDLWQCVVCLYTLAVGIYPYGSGAEEPCPDERLSGEFYLCANDGIERLIRHHHMHRLGFKMVSRGAIDLMQRMMKVQLKDRLSLQQVLQHEWITNSECERPGYT